MSTWRLGVILPCRNEERVIGRKLANLAQARWPAGAHTVVVVDDGSSDRTRALALAATPQPQGVRVRVVDNAGAAGKSGAVRTGCEVLAGQADLLVLSDADVLVHADALLELQAAFERDARLLLACGAQRFVSNLDSLEPVDHPFDRLTAAVRGLESRLGKLFSVHGQLAAWRADAGLLPAVGRPADDLDLMFSARRAGGRVALVPGARFFELKVESDDQAIRRARAYFEALRDRRRPLGDGLFDRAQWSFYRSVPALLPRLVLPLRPLLRRTHRGRRLLRLMDVIRAAQAQESCAPLSDRWEMQRS